MRSFQRDSNGPYCRQMAYTSYARLGPSWSFEDCHGRLSLMASNALIHAGKTQTDSDVYLATLVWRIKVVLSAE